MQVTSEKFVEKECFYTGRNGTGKCRGVDILATQNETAIISPINSKGHIARCEMEIPVQDIPSLTAKLNNVGVDTDAKEKLIEKVIDQILVDGNDGDTKKVAELLNFISVQHLKGFLPDDEDEEEDDTSCSYCGGNCPNDEDNCCDGYSGDIDGLDTEYYEIHVEDTPSYSIFFKANSKLNTTDEMVSEAREQNLLDASDVPLVEYGLVITKEEYDHANGE